MHDLDNISGRRSEAQLVPLGRRLPGTLDKASRQIRQQRRGEVIAMKPERGADLEPDDWPEGTFH